MALLIPTVLGSCYVTSTRPRVVQPRYVAYCPRGYTYDGTYCVSRHGARIDVRYQNRY
jgi:hypothetical protein